MADKLRAYACNFIFYGDDDVDALKARILAALEVEGLDFDPMTLDIIRVDSPDDDEDGTV